MIEEVGQTIFDILSNAPAGALVFFSSYQLMNKIKGIWLQQKIYYDLNRMKRIFIETKDKAQFKREFEAYKKKCSTGAVYLAVFRGKLSEGIDFTGDMARTVIVVGIPYPSLGDINVNMKRDYNDKMSRFNQEVVTGSEWYSIQALRAVNQAVGRVIRNINDYGSFFLIDERYNRKQVKSMLSHWIQKHFNNFVQLNRNLFQNKQKRKHQKRNQRKMK